MYNCNPAAATATRSVLSSIIAATTTAAAAPECQLC